MYVLSFMLVPFCLICFCHWYRKHLSLLIFVPADVGPETNVGISPGSNDQWVGGIFSPGWSLQPGLKVSLLIPVGDTN
jgi:hypothetical protein